MDTKSASLIDVNPPAVPPPRSVDLAGYRTPDDKRTWDNFCYQTPQRRREVAAAYAAQVRERSKQEQRDSGLYDDTTDALIKVPSLPPMTVVLIGGPCSGKGTIAPMLSQAFRTRVMGVGQLLRGEVRAGTPRGLEARALMQRGELLDDEFVCSMLASRVSGSWDAKQNGVLLDGFPRSTGQAAKVCEGSGSGAAALRPDCVIVLERPDELVKEFALGRMTDSATGQTYHPIYAPAPEEVQARLVWRLDDTPDVIEKRCSDFRESVEAICDIFGSAGVPLKIFDNARSELHTFAEVAQFVEDTARHKLRETGGWNAVFERIIGELKTVELPLVDQDDVLPMCDLGTEGEEACLQRWEEEARPGLAAGEPLLPESVGERRVEEVRYEEETSPLLRIARRCNSFDGREFVPVLVGDEQVGCASRGMMKALEPYLAQGHTCELVRLREDGVDPRGAASAPGELDIQGFDLAVRLAPDDADMGANTVAVRSARVAALVQELVADGVISASALRNELQDVRPMTSGFLSGPSAPSPLLRMERAAMIYFGVPSFGVHLNGFVRDAVSGRPAAVWIAKRSMSKATYPGLLDQMVAGGQPTGMSFQENIRKESEEEASLPPEVVWCWVCLRLACVSHVSFTSLARAARAPLSRHLLGLCADLCSRRGVASSLCSRHHGTQRQLATQTERQRDRETERQRDRETERQRDNVAWRFWGVRYRETT